MTPEQLWQDFVEKYPSYKGKSYDVFVFGDNPDELLRLVLCGEKTATCCIYRETSTTQAGDISIILDSTGNARAIIENTKVKIVPFDKVTANFARKEGEGDKTLATWRKIHKAYWKDITPDTMLECEEFRLLYSVD